MYIYVYIYIFIIDMYLQIWLCTYIIVYSTFMHNIPPYVLSSRWSSRPRPLGHISKQGEQDGMSIKLSCNIHDYSWNIYGWLWMIMDDFSRPNVVWLSLIPMDFWNYIHTSWDWSVGKVIHDRIGRQFPGWDLWAESAMFNVQLWAGRSASVTRPAGVLTFRQKGWGWWGWSCWRNGQGCFVRLGACLLGFLLSIAGLSYVLLLVTWFSFKEVQRGSLSFILTGSCCWAASQPFELVTPVGHGHVMRMPAQFHCISNAMILLISTLHTSFDFTKRRESSV